MTSGWTARLAGTRLAAIMTFGQRVRPSRPFLAVLKRHARNAGDCGNSMQIGVEQVVLLDHFLRVFVRLIVRHQARCVGLLLVIITTRFLFAAVLLLLLGMPLLAGLMLRGGSGRRGSGFRIGRARGCSHEVPPRAPPLTRGQGPLPKARNFAIPIKRSSPSGQMSQSIDGSGILTSIRSGDVS